MRISDGSSDVCSSDLSRSGDKGLPNAPYTDTHMLCLSDTAYNGDRGNKPYADCPASSNCGARATEANDGRGGGSGARTEERSEGKGWVRKMRLRWWPNHYKKNSKNKRRDKKQK